MAFLQNLTIFQALFARWEVAAGILLVRIQKQRIHLARKIVMCANILTRQFGWIKFQDMPDHPPHGLSYGISAVLVTFGTIQFHQSQQIENLTVLNGDFLVRKAFRQRKPRIGRQFECDTLGVKSNGDFRLLAGSKSPLCSTSVNNGQRPDLDRLIEKSVQQHNFKSQFLMRNNTGN